MQNFVQLNDMWLFLVCLLLCNFLPHMNSEIDARAIYWNEAYRIKLDKILKAFETRKHHIPDIHKFWLALEFQISRKHLIMWYIGLVAKQQHSIYLTSISYVRF